jgi:hypothetical protein
LKKRAIKYYKDCYKEEQAKFMESQKKIKKFYQDLEKMDEKSKRKKLNAMYDTRNMFM